MCFVVRKQEFAFTLYGLYKCEISPSLFVVIKDHYAMSRAHKIDDSNTNFFPQRMQYGHTRDYITKRGTY